MAGGWDYLVRQIRRRRTGASPAAGERSIPQVPQSTLEINLGIDFGTSYTKVCFRDSGAEQSGVVRLGNGGDAIIPSVVCIDSNGKLQMKHLAAARSKATEIRFLKMRLAGAAIEDDRHTGAALSADSDFGCRALSAWFLAQVIAQSRRVLAKSEAQRFLNRRVVWSANLGVPVEHYDSPAINVFNEVLGIAWHWSDKEQLPETLDQCISSYERDLEIINPAAVDFHAVPEIAAAVQSFVISRAAVPGFYVYFDIGGGTVDGVAFNFLNNQGERAINFYSGKVGSLGMSVFDLRSEEIKYELQCLVATVIHTAKQKDGRDWRLVNIQRDTQRRILGRINPQDIHPLTVFLGGYGAENPWYRKSIASTYKDFNHHSAGIPPYELNLVPAPGDLAMGKDDQFARFAIAYGLSISYGEGPVVRLPSQIEARNPPARRRVGNAVDYGDSKDVYD